MMSLGEAILVNAGGGFMVWGAEAFGLCPDCGPDHPREAGHGGRHNLKGLGGGKW